MSFMNEWYSQTGPMEDVILSSRIRLSRNLTGHQFPGSMGHQEEETVRNKILSAFSRLSPDEDLHALSLEELRPNERRLLFEKKLISQDFSLNKEKTLVLDRNYQFSGMINGEDHLRMAALSGGLSLRDLYARINRVDESLEEVIDFAATLELGYLAGDLQNLGTGMKASLMVHLPALVETGLIEKALKAMLHADFQVKGFFGDDEESLGQFYLVANRNTLGVSEEEIQEKLEGMAQQLVTYERMAREDLLSKKQLYLEDRVFRALGLLKSCRLLSYRESVEAISSLRMGVILKWLELPPEKLNALLITGQTSHLQERLLRSEGGSDEQAVDQERAGYFREELFGTGIQKEMTDV